MTAHQAPLSLGFSRQEHWSGLPFPSPIHESEKWKWSRSVMSKPSATPWTSAYQAPLSMGFSRQEYWSGMRLPSPRRCSSFILLQVVDQFSQHHLLKRLSFCHCIFLPPLSKIRCPYVRGFISGLSILFHWSVFLSLCQYHTVWMTGFVAEPEVRQVYSSSSILLCQDCFGYSWFFVFPYKLWNFLF